MDRTAGKGGRPGASEGAEISTLACDPCADLGSAAFVGQNIWVLLGWIDFHHTSGRFFPWFFHFKPGFVGSGDGGGS